MRNLLSPFMSNTDSVAFSSKDKNFFSLFSNNKINSANAQKIADVFACVNLKANTLATIPLKLYKESKSGKEEHKTHRLYTLLRKEPNPNLTYYEWAKMISQDLDLRGNHYSQIIKNGLGEVVALYPLKADNMSVKFINKNNKLEKIYEYGEANISSDRILHLIDIPDSEGLKGISKITYARNTLEFANNASIHGNKLFKNQAAPSGAFTNPGELSDEAFKRLKEDLEDQYTGLEKAGKPLLLEGGLTFTPISLSNSDSQWLESRKLNRENIAAIFGVSPSMIGDSSASSYGNLEQKYLEFQTTTVLALLTAIEQKLWQKLLTPTEKQSLIIKFNANALLRADAKSKSEYYKAMWQIGALSPNEIRSNEDLNSYEGGDEYFMQLSYAPVSKIVSGETTQKLTNFPRENKE